jgi:hypothetical protein
MMIFMRKSALLLTLVFSIAAQAQERCGFEIKILLAPQPTESVVASLNASEATTGQVYFFDTSGLDLLSRGVIIRLRQGLIRDLTIKLRPVAGKKFVDPSGGKEKFKCEVDLIEGAATYSYSVQRQLPRDQMPETGPEVYRLLTAGQNNLIKQAQIAIDWTQVKKIAVIQSTDWRAKARQPFNELALEFWEWQGGKILEVSTKVSAAAGPSRYAELEQLLKSKGIALSSQQQFKTAKVLETLVRPAAE